MKREYIELNDPQLFLLFFMAGLLVIAAYSLGKYAHASMVPTVKTPRDWVKSAHTRYRMQSAGMRVIPGNVEQASQPERE